MTAIQVPAGNIAGMVFSLAVSWGLPAALLVIIRRRWKADILPFVLGSASFFLFAMLLEQLLHSLVLLRLGSVSQMLKDNLWMYAIYGGLAAGVFEETGRYLTMRFLMNKNLTRENALMYGAGHGGMEAVLILGMASFNNIFTSLLLNSGKFMDALAESADVQQMLDAVAPLGTLPAWQFFLGGVERILAIFLHLGLSLLVYQAVRNRGKWYYYPLAILLHMVINAVVIMIANNGNLVLAEGVTFAGTAAVVWFSWQTVWNCENHRAQ